MTFKKISTALYIYLSLITGCRGIPTATPEEIRVRDEWAASIPADDRRRIMEEASHHGEWGEKRKIRFEVEQFQRVLKRQPHSSDTTRPSTNPISH